MEWNQINNGLNDLNIYTLYTHKNNLYAGTHLGVFLSTNNGKNWEALNSEMQDFSISSIAIYDTTIFACNGYDVYSSSDNGAHWINTRIKGTSYQVIYASSLIIQDTIVFAGTSINGIWSRKISDLVTEIEENDPPPVIQFSLSQNYPNPFNPTTNFEFRIPASTAGGSDFPAGSGASGFVSLKIYDVLGNEVASLVNEEKAAGTYKVNFNADNLSSGVYFYQLKAGKFISTKKMLLLK